MLKKLLKGIKLKDIRALHKRNGEILDIILFGSVVRGKNYPKDIDVLVLFSRGIDDKTTSDLEALLRQSEYNFQVTTATYSDLFSPTFLARDTLFDGISLITGKSLAEGFGYKSFVLFKYSLKGFTNSKRVRFFYALKGRYKKGFLNEMGYRLGKDAFIIFSSKSEEFKTFLNLWNVSYQEIEVLIPARREVVLK